MEIACRACGYRHDNLMDCRVAERLGIGRSVGGALPAEQTGGASGEQEVIADPGSMPVEKIEKVRKSSKAELEALLESEQRRKAKQRARTAKWRNRKKGLPDDC